MTESAASLASQEVRHVPFNPVPMGLMSSPLAAICDDHERGGWRLVQVVPHHQYESIAVFVREATDGH